MWLDPRNGPDADLVDPMMGSGSGVGSRTYVIASVPRSGSTLLGRQLTASGQAGDPKEYLNPMQVRDWELRLGSTAFRRLRHRALWGPLVPLAGRTRWSDARLCAYLEGIRARRSSGGWFGLKLHHHHARRWFFDVGRDPADLLGVSRWVWITRRDHLAQAVSWSRALTSGRWASWQSGRGVGVYDRRLITRCLRAVEEAEAGWEAYFATRGLVPHRVVYEDLVDDLDGTVRAVLRHLDGVDVDRVALPPPDLSRQADTVSAAWVARYRDEGGA